VKIVENYSIYEAEESLSFLIFKKMEYINTTGIDKAVTIAIVKKKGSSTWVRA